MARTDSEICINCLNPDYNDNTDEADFHGFNLFVLIREIRGQKQTAFGLPADCRGKYKTAFGKTGQASGKLNNTIGR